LHLHSYDPCFILNHVIILRFIASIASEFYTDENEQSTNRLYYDS